MIVLAIDTCGSSGTIALGNVDGEGLHLLGQAELAGKTYSAKLMPAIVALLEVHSMDLAALDAIVVVNGPGSFTGVRIGVSTVKGLGEALRIPVLPVSRLGVLAWKAETEFAVLDAGRGELYFRDGSSEVLMDAKAAAETIDFPAICDLNTLQFFPGAALIDPPNAGDAIRFALPQLLAGDFPDLVRIDGNYLRRSDAEILAKATGKA
jgi:tRNA threonylcarbamoyladenosine biosynthesis protein TsaB